mmetsp:Transcript_32514/g.100639  ORF Transcript_32514/g.100639 Transcript_32514/m.100639 type:complete len:126 (-) Transcript_32514:249-626(-)
MVRLYVVHGLKQRPGPPTSRHRFGRPRRAKGFDLADPDVQLHLLDTCRLAAASDKLHARAHFAAPESSGSFSAESCGVGLHASPPFRTPERSELAGTTRFASSTSSRPTTSRSGAWRCRWRGTRS